MHRCAEGQCGTSSCPTCFITSSVSSILILLWSPRRLLHRVVLSLKRFVSSTLTLGSVVHDTRLSGVAGTKQLPALDDTLSVDYVNFDFNERFAALDCPVESDYVNLHFESDPWFPFHRCRLIDSKNRPETSVQTLLLQNTLSAKNP